MPAAAGPDSERLVRMVCYTGLIALPVLMLFVHLLLVYRA
jgi:hypothetical protein